MKKLKRKLLTAMLYTICWRNVDKHVSLRHYDSNNIELRGDEQGMIKKVSDLREYDRNMTVGEIIKQFKEERPYICPKCKGRGEIWHKKEEDYGWARFYDEGRYIECDICNGHGRTKEEYKPQYELIGYEKVEK